MEKEKKIVNLSVVKNDKAIQDGVKDAMSWTPEQAFSWMQDNPERANRKIVKMVCCYMLDDDSTGYLAAGCTTIEAIGLVDYVTSKNLKN